jgi:hypothetical protein
MEQWIKAHVVVDVANVAANIGKARRSLGTSSPTYVEPSLRHLQEVLGHVGVSVTGWTVAIGEPGLTRRGKALSKGDLSSIKHVRRTMNAWLGEAKAEADSMELPLVVIRGGFDGGEFAVDDLVVAAAIARGAELDADAAVLVISDDEDVHVAFDYLQGAAGYAVLREGRIRRPTNNPVRWLRLDDGMFARMADGSSAGLPEVSVRRVDGVAELMSSRSGETPTAISSDLAADRTGPQHRNMPDASVDTLVVVDAWDVMRSATASIGIGRIPSPESVVSVLGQLEIDGPIAQWWVVPEVPDDVLHRIGDRRDPRRKAWAEAEELHDELNERLEDPAEMLWSLAESRVKRVGPGTGAIEKRATAIIVADVVHALLHTDDHVVVLSDRAEVELSLRRLHELGLDPSRVTRVGAHPDLLAGGSVPLAGHAMIELTESLMAELAEVSEPAHGDKLRSRLAGVVGAPMIEWDFVRFAPDSDGIVVRHSTEPDLEILMSGFLGATASLVARATREGFTTGARGGTRLGLEFRSDRPCAIPTVVLGAGVDRQYAVVEDHHGSVVGLDLDGDGVTDVDLQVGHGDLPYLDDELVIVGVQDGEHRLVGRAVSPDREAPGITRIEVATVDGVLHGRGVHGTGPLAKVRQGSVLPGPLQSGDQLFALLDVADSSWRPLSTALRHLEAVPQS